MVSTDKLRLQQVLLNYQSNAIKFTPSEGKILIRCVKTERQNEQDSILLQVIDNGIGIKEEDQKKLFQVFGYLQETE